MVSMCFSDVCNLLGIRLEPHYLRANNTSLVVALNLLA